MDSSDGCSRLPAGAPAPFPVNPISTPDPRVPLLNLSVIRKKMDSLRDFLSLSIESNSQLDDEQIGFVSMEITSAIQNIIVNGAALVASSLQPSLPSGSVGNVETTGGFGAGNVSAPLKRTKLGEFSNLGNRLLPAAKMTDPPDVTAPACYPVPGEVFDSWALRNLEDQMTSNAAAAVVGSANQEYPWETANDQSTTMNLAAVEPKEANLREPYQGINDDSEIIELDAVELLAEHIHFCEICGKGFKRDANLRMHMRAHGDQFKTLEALARPGKSWSGSAITKARFSCPFPGCNRNRGHKKFRPLKSVICVKNHFKRSHCPRMYLCNRCNKKSFSVVADLKSHLKHCGECRWKCSCGTTFSRKDKLFGHLALFEGHMPAVMEEEKSKELVGEEDFLLDEEDLLDNGFFEGLLDGSDPVDSNSLEDVTGFSSLGPTAGVDKI